MHSNEKEVSILAGAVIYCLVVYEVLASLLKHRFAFCDVSGTKKINASQYVIVDSLCFVHELFIFLW